MNTIGTSTIGTSWRAKYFSTNLQQVLRKNMVAEAICTVDKSDSFYIHNPYQSRPTATIQAVAGTYAVTAYTITDDSLTVTDEVIYAEQIFDFERVMNNYDLMANRMDEMAYAIAYGIDYYVLNAMAADGTGTYTTPVGGFATPSNIAKIAGDLWGKVSGYADPYKGVFLVIESTDVTGFVQAQVASGFSYADAALRNGFIANYAGIDVYIVRTGTFVTATIGTRTVTNSGYRLFGVKGVNLYASPRGIQYDEKGVSGKTGKEVVVYGYIASHVWVQKAPLIVPVKLA